MHKSWFEYSITRPYPFRWFTPVVIIGGVVLAVIFSLVNLSSNGYYPKTIYTGNVNETEHKFNSRWFHKRPFNWEHDMDAECQPYILAVGSSFYTSNLGFQYTVKKINIPGNDTHAASTLPAIGYKNTTLKNCRVSELKLVLDRSPNSGANSWWFSFKKSTVATTLRCTVVYDSGVADVTLGAEYAGSVSTYEYIIDDDYNTSASVWWGTRLSNAYFTGVLASAAQATLPQDRFINDAELIYAENELVKDLHSEDFFKLNWNFGLSDAKVFHLGMDGADEVPVYNNGRVGSLPSSAVRFWYQDADIDKFYGSPSITEGLHFAKIMHSVFALDLGNCDAPNLLLDNEGLKYAVLAPDDGFRKEGALLNDTRTFESKDGGRYSNIPAPGDDLKFTRLYDAYKTFPSQMGELACKNATIVAQYLCSVPQPKSPGVMILAIIIADLVFLQAAWKLMQWVSGRMLKQPDAMICKGCRAARLNETELEYNPNRSSQYTETDQESLLRVKPLYNRLGHRER